MKKILFCLLMICSSVFAADWPTKPITIIVPYAPGGANDRIARQFALNMETILKKPVAVVYHPGAGNTIALIEMEKMDPNHTFMLPNGEIITGPASQGKDTYKDYHPIMIFATAPQMVFRNPKVDKDDFVKRAKAGDSIQVAVPDVANPATIWLQQLSPLKSETIPYKGGAQTVFAVTAKQIDYGVGTIANGWGGITNNQIVPVMLGDTKRSPLLPDVPTYLELGFKGKPNVLWFGLIASNKIDPTIESRMENITKFVVETQAIKDMSKTGLVIKERTNKESNQIYQETIKNLK
jgi:hypothetical protein